jgi:hypothetical protein
MDVSASVSSNDGFLIWGNGTAMNGMICYKTGDWFSCLQIPHFHGIVMRARNSYRPIGAAGYGHDRGTVTLEGEAFAAGGEQTPRRIL